MTDAPMCRYCGGRTEYKFPNRNGSAFKCEDCGEFTTLLAY